MAELAWRCPTAAGAVHVVVTDRADGDFHRDRVAPAELRARRRRVIDAPWTMLDEVHGARVVTVGAPGEHDGATADAAVTTLTGAALGLWTGDCAPLVVVAPGGAFGVAHVGWRGLAGGIVGALAGAVGGGRAYLGPAIGPCCYEFGPELVAVADALDVPAAAITGRTRWGTASLDIHAAARVALDRAGAVLVATGPCTRCDTRYFSHRRGDPQRHVTAAWRPPLEAS